VDPAHADLLLGSPLGRQFLTDLLESGQGESGREDSRQEESGREESWRLLDLDEGGLLAALAADTSGFGFAGDETAPALTEPERRELRRVADELVSAPATRRWWQPVMRADQRFLEWDGSPHPEGAAIEQAVRDGMRQERAENAAGLRHPRPPERPGTIIGATWWSAPDFAQQTWTAGAVGDIPALALGHFIDTFNPFEETGATVWSVRIAERARLLEITDPAGWQALVRRFPRDVTGTHDGEWRYWGGVPGPWRLPDWEQVMEHYDGVHVTIGGYVASCGLALPVGDGYTMLAGWIPDATLWLRDVRTGTRRLGRWQGHPQNGDWDYVRERWTPDDDQR
jgi:hypothetical protein